MPRLQNQRHEIFAQYVVSGLTKARAYEKAGFEYNVSNAARVSQYEEVAERIKELADERAHKAAVSHVWVLGRLKRLAIHGKHESARVRALELIAKHLGMFEHKQSVHVHHTGIGVEQKPDLSRLAPEEFTKLRELVDKSRKSD